ncbi:MAG: zf-HC2 domain-containing protein [Candidatus Aminicenantes bacterium]|jgi:hypothetical protein
MKCEECKNLIAVSVYGKLTSQEKRQLEDHLRECPECTRIYKKSENLGSLFEDKEEIPLPDKEKSWDIISSKAVPRESKKTIFFPYKKWAYAASALIIVFILGFLVGKQVFFPGPGETPPESIASQGYESPLLRYTEGLEPILINFVNRTDARKQQEMSDIEKLVIKDMLIQTKLLKHLVAQRDDPRLLQLLEDIEFILVGISNLKPQDQESAAQLTRLIRENEIKLKLKAFLASQTTI